MKEKKRYLQHTRTWGTDERSDGHVDVGGSSLPAVKALLVRCLRHKFPQQLEMFLVLLSLGGRHDQAEIRLVSTLSWCSRWRESRRNQPTHAHTRALTHRRALDPRTLPPSVALAVLSQDPRLAHDNAVDASEERPERHRFLRHRWHPGLSSSLARGGQRNDDKKKETTQISIVNVTVLCVTRARARPTVQRERG